MLGDVCAPGHSLTGLRSNFAPKIRAPRHPVRKETRHRGRQLAVGWLVLLGSGETGTDSAGMPNDSNAKGETMASIGNRNMTRILRGLSLDMYRRSFTWFSMIFQGCALSGGFWLHASGLGITR